jgi:predicted transcriptional regulator/rubrerythrin
LSRSAGLEGVLTGVRVILAQNLSRAGWSYTNIARVLGISPAAVTLYAKGRRGRSFAGFIRNSPSAASILDEVTNSVIEAIRKNPRMDVFPLILDAAYKVMRIMSGEGITSKHCEDENPNVTKTSSTKPNSVIRSLQSRLEDEQKAARRSMVLAAGAKNEVAKAVFRQIATDSIRHADLISMVLDKINIEGKKWDHEYDSTNNLNSTVLHDIETMLAEEERAGDDRIRIFGVRSDLTVLLKSIELDERKHRILLTELLRLFSKRTSDTGL